MPVVTAPADEDRRTVDPVPDSPLEVAPDLGEVGVLRHVLVEAGEVEADPRRVVPEVVGVELALVAEGFRSV